MLVLSRALSPAHICLGVLPWEHPPVIMLVFGISMETGTMVPPSGTAMSLQDRQNLQLSFALLRSIETEWARIIKLVTFRWKAVSTAVALSQTFLSRKIISVIYSVIKNINTESLMLAQSGVGGILILFYRSGFSSFSQERPPQYICRHLHITDNAFKPAC